MAQDKYCEAGAINCMGVGPNNGPDPQYQCGRCKARSPENVRVSHTEWIATEVANARENGLREGFEYQTAAGVIAGLYRECETLDKKLQDTEAAREEAFTNWVHFKDRSELYAGEIEDLKLRRDVMREVVAEITGYPAEEVEKMVTNAIAAKMVGCRP